MNAASLITLAAMAANQYNPDQLTIKSLDLDELYMVSKHHQMTAIAAYALASAGISDSRFIEDQAKAIRKNIILDNDRRDILAAFEDAHIWYMPLKGIVMKNYYPEIGMRQMSDNDILFDASRAEEVRNIMEGLGFTTIHFGEGHQDDYQKPPVSHFEMHRMLFAPTADILFYEYYRDIEKKLIVGKGYERYFSNEDFYIYMITHEYKHFTWNGTGLRSLLDTYVYLKKFRDTMDWNYIESEIRKLGVSEFEKKNRELAIKEAYKLANANDVVVVAGKGHEDYQILANETIHFDDREKVKEIFVGV